MLVTATYCDTAALQPNILPKRIEFSKHARQIQSTARFLYRINIILYYNIIAIIKKKNNKNRKRLYYSTWKL